MVNEKHISLSESQTILLGEEFAKKLKSGDTVAISGDLGTGKTEFIKGICRYFKIDEIVTSPTFSIINQYHAHSGKGDFPIYHIDLYRISKAEELENIGFSECVHSDKGIKLIEWAENANGSSPDYTYKVSILADDENEDMRHIKVEYQISEEEHA
ncbi:MAG: hypothetical protein Kapaf2KO_15430 [Candidatus Kapaibacteriales bacterium]